MKSSNNKRKKIPSNIEAEVMFFSNLNCCIDNKRGDHIHHIDNNYSNNNLDNLALLCFDCHNKASLKGGLSKKLSAKTIIRFRSHHYHVIQNMRKADLKKINTSINKLSVEDLVSATTTSIILLEISKIKEEYFKSVRLDRNDILERFLSYQKQNNTRIAYEIFDFLKFVSYETRSDLPSKMINTVNSLIILYFPIQRGSTNNNQFYELGKQALYIGYTIVYNCSIHFKNLTTLRIGYSIIKYVYIKAKERKNKKLITNVQNIIKEIESHLKRPERNDLKDVQKIFKIHKIDLDVPGMMIPSNLENLLKTLKDEN